MRSTEVSVVIPTRDRWALAGITAATALRQEDVELEVLLVDDGSAEDRGKELDDGTGRLRVLRRERPDGVATARNLGLAAAESEWVAFLDDDDVWAPRHLALVLGAIRSTGADWGYGGQILIDGQARPLELRPAPPAGGIALQLLARNVIGTPSCVVARTELVRAASGFDPAFAVLADWDLWLRLAALGPAASSDEITVGYRRHPTNMHLEMDAVLSEMPLLRHRHGVDEEDFAEWVAGGFRARGRRRRAAAWYLRRARLSRRARDVFRAGGVLLGEPAMVRFRRALHDGGVPAPDWLASLPGRGRDGD